MITAFGSKRVNLRYGRKVYIAYLLIFKQSHVLKRQPYKTSSQAKNYARMVLERYERMCNATRQTA